ncbi:MAG: hypothetical protein KAS32_24275, partial [Candidatus Peribacteraceae bacterium]|nr:hypothetical protein [Candidatus Peribacteraceae bacterium]
IGDQSVEVVNPQLSNKEVVANVVNARKVDEQQPIKVIASHGWDNRVPKPKAISPSPQSETVVETVEETVVTEVETVSVEGVEDLVHREPEPRPEPEVSPENTETIVTTPSGGWVLGAGEKMGPPPNEGGGEKMGQPEELWTGASTGIWKT